MKRLLRWAARRPKTTVALAIVLGGPVLAHLSVRAMVRMTPPIVNLPALVAKDEPWGRRAGEGFTRVVGQSAEGPGVRVVALRGSPEEMGAQHATLLRDHMLANEAVLWDGFATVVPLSPARALMFDLGQFRYRHVDQGFPEARKRELAAEAATFQPDPYAGHMPTYPRMVFLHALYDIALSFEHSPLLGTGPSPPSHEGPRLDGCTAFGLGPAATADGHALFGRAFDFEAADVFDRDKAVFLVQGEGAIPFASVAWPGLVGVMTGMNAEGVAVAVNGGRAREPRTTGVPVAFSLRETLERAHDTEEAIAILGKQEPMVSHIVFVGDARGNFAVVERAPGVPAFVRRGADPARIAVTNHFEGLLMGDPSDTRVRESTSTLPRRARIDELLERTADKSATVARAVETLRDHTCAASVGSCPVGDRRTIDAFIATHGVVFDMTEKALWVSEGPHLSGRFVKIALGSFVSPGDAQNVASPREDVFADEHVQTIPADEALWDGRYREGRKRAGGPLMGAEQPVTLPAKRDGGT